MCVRVPRAYCSRLGCRDDWERGPVSGAGEGTEVDGGASWHGLNIVGGGGDLRSVGHESQWGMPRTWREGRRVANAAEGETSEPPQPRSRRETALLKGSPCCRLCERAPRLSPFFPRCPPRSLPLPSFFHSLVRQRESDHGPRYEESSERERGSWSHEGCSRGFAAFAYVNSARDRPSCEGSSRDNSSPLIELIDSSCHVILSTVTSRRTQRILWSRCAWLISLAGSS